MKVPVRKKKAAAVAEEVEVADAGEEDQAPAEDQPLDPPLRPLGESAHALVRFGQEDHQTQRKNAALIDEAFLDYLSTDPSREEFCEVMHGVLMTAQMLWTAMKAHR